VYRVVETSDDLMAGFRAVINAQGKLETLAMSTRYISEIRCFNVQPQEQVPYEMFHRGYPWSIIPGANACGTSCILQ
jgi:hypothetical protein